MIDFKKDGPLGAQAHELFMNPLRIVGVGQTGGNILDQIVLRTQQELDLLFVDTDRQTVDASVVMEKRLLGEKAVRGLGCHGDRELGRRIAAAEEELWEETVAGARFLILAVGLGGGTGSAMALALLEAAQRAETQVVVVCTLPLSFEGERRAREAQEDLAALREKADAVLVFHNDRLAGLPAARTDVRQAFHVLNQHLAVTIQALVQVLTQEGMIQLSFADVRSLYGRFRGNEILENSWVGYAEARGGDDEGKLIRDLLDSPLLVEEEIWNIADHGILNLSGGSDLSLGDVQAITKELQKQLPKNFPVAVNANLEEKHTGSVRLTLLLAVTRAPEGVEPMEVEKAVPVASLEEIEPKKSVTKKKAPVRAASDTQAIDVKVPPRVKPMRPQPMEDELIPMAEMVSAAPSAESGKGKAKKYLAKQEELPFELANRGRFENSIETIYKGENLDQPTFRRRRLVIRL